MKNHKGDLSNRMYREHILELYKNPSNYGNMKNHTHQHTENNSLCGDEIKIQLLVKNKRVESAMFSGSGCVISMVSASLLTEKLKGMKISDVNNINKNEILKIMKIKVNPARVKCVLLPLDAVKNAIKKNA